MELGQGDRAGALGVILLEQRQQARGGRPAVALALRQARADTQIHPAEQRPP